MGRRVSRVSREGGQAGQPGRAGYGGLLSGRGPTLPAHPGASAQRRGQACPADPASEEAVLAWASTAVAGGAGKGLGRKLAAAAGQARGSAQLAPPAVAACGRGRRGPQGVRGSTRASLLAAGSAASPPRPTANVPSARCNG